MVPGIPRLRADGGHLRGQLPRRNGEGFRRGEIRPFVLRGDACPFRYDGTGFCGRQDEGQRGFRPLRGDTLDVKERTQVIQIITFGIGEQVHLPRVIDEVSLQDKKLGDG